jgi:hypothetical protein
MPAESLIPIFASLVGGVCSLAGSFGATTWAKQIERRHEARQLAKAFKGELGEDQE